MNRKEIYEGKLQMDYFSDSYLKFEEDFYRYSALGEPLTTLTDDILRAMAMSQKNYFKLSKRHSKDGRDHYFYFTIEFSKTEVGVRKFEYNTHNSGLPSWKELVDAFANELDISENKNYSTDNLKIAALIILRVDYRGCFFCLVVQ